MTWRPFEIGPGCPVTESLRPLLERMRVSRGLLAQQLDQQEVRKIRNLDAARKTRITPTNIGIAAGVALAMAVLVRARRRR